MEKELVRHYIQAYNQCDVAGMLASLHSEVVFRNYAGGQLTLELKGKQAFQEQAEAAVKLFKEREQKVTSWEETEEGLLAHIAYEGVLAVDVPSGPKVGERLILQGKSVFTFKEGKIISLEDHS